MTGNPSFDKILMAASLLGTLLAAGLVYYSHAILQRTPENRSELMHALGQQSFDGAQIQSVNFPKMAVNLYSRETRLRFLEVQFSIEPFENKHTELLKDKKPLINDVLIDIAGNISPDELNSVTGRILLEGRMKARINESLGKMIIKKIYFSRFIIQ